MERQPVSSANLASAGHDAKGETLEIEFKNGSVYQFDGVPEETFKGLMSANSPGGFFHQNIRDKFPFTRL